MRAVTGVPGLIREVVALREQVRVLKLEVERLSAYRNGTTKELLDIIPLVGCLLLVSRIMRADGAPPGDLRQGIPVVSDHSIVNDTASVLAQFTTVMQSELQKMNKIFVETSTLLSTRVTSLHLEAQVEFSSEIISYDHELVRICEAPST